MSFSLFKKNQDKKIPSIPPEILRAVKVMGDPETNTTPTSSEKRTESGLKTGNPGPFLGGAIPSEKKEPIKSDVKEESPRVMGLAPAKSQKNTGEKPKKGYLKFVLIFLLIVLVASLGLYYWFFIVVPQKEALKNVAEDIVEATVTPESIPETPLPYSIDTPNYLSIDVEVATEEDIQKKIEEASQSILSAQISKPIEFIVTDKNNNPIAFSRLAFIAHIGLAPDLLLSLGEAFSLYLYNDMGKVYVGLSVSLADRDKAIEEIEKEEKGIPAALQNILYPDVPSISESAFRSGSYQNQTVRYVNIDETKRYSFDYMIREKDWLMGSSKDTLRALSDKK